MKDAPKIKKVKPNPDIALINLHAKLDALIEQQKELVKAHNSVTNFINEVGKRAQEDMEKAKKKEKSFLSWFFGLQK